MLRLSAIFTILMLSMASTVAAQTPVSTCGSSGQGDLILTADLACSGDGVNGIVLNGRSTLLLDGRTLTMTDANSTAILCQGRCKIVGPGSIVLDDDSGIGVEGGVRKIRLEGVTISGGGRGVDQATADNRAAVFLKDTVIDGATIAGISSEKRVVLKDSSVTNSGRNGVLAITPDCKRGKISLKNSQVIGSAQDNAVCGVSETCADLVSCRSPKVKKASLCDSSHDAASGFPGASWGVCALD